MKRTSVITISLVISVAFLIFAYRPVLGANVLLKTQAQFPMSLQGLGTTLDFLAKQVEAASNGTIKMKVYEPGKLIPPAEILDAVHKGKIEAGYSCASRWVGMVGGAAEIFAAVPFGPEYLEFAAWFYEGDGMKLYQEMYDRAGYNVKVFLCGILAPETSGWFKKPIEKPGDLKGMKMRFMGLGGKVMGKLGMSTSLWPLGETFAALEKGVLDATEVCTPAVDEGLGLYKLLKHNYFPGWHQPATTTELLINKDVWNKMSESQKALMDIATRAATLNEMTVCEYHQGYVIQENVQKRGVVNHYWSEEFLELFNEKWNEVIKEERQKDEFFSKVFDNLQSFRETYRYWSSLGFMPRPTPEETGALGGKK